MALVFYCLAFVCFGVMDFLRFWYTGYSQFWNPHRSWQNKWKPLVPHSRVGLTTLYNPAELKERFWGSSRWFVFLTDGWHLVQWLAYGSLAIGTALLFPLGLTTLWAYLIYHALFTTIKSITMKVMRKYGNN